MSHSIRLCSCTEAPPMPLLIALNFLIQLLFVIHVYRSRAPRYWVFVILAFPIAGCLAYVAFEVFSHTREASAARRKAREIVNAFDPEKELRAKADELALCGSIDSRVSLAEECIAAKLSDEAARLYRSCLVGAYQDDPHLLFGLARVLVEQGANDEAAETITRLRAAHPCHNPNDARLLYARVLEARGETATALAEYREARACLCRTRSEVPLRAAPAAAWSQRSGARGVRRGRYASKAHFHTARVRGSVGGDRPPALEETARLASRRAPRLLKLQWNEGLRLS